MSRKHFKYIADSLRQNRPDDSDSDLGRMLQWNCDVLAMAIVCRHFNPNFNHERFLDACGGLTVSGTSEIVELSEYSKMEINEGRLSYN